ncbi:MAG TPA: hypothetical protein VG456_18185 [Candidatus Sulfopaludibacter sp.]|jgi:hypothetical protein|nr:hypothetical protein [Candidatus Sulfopaludibacter sp.]
MRAALLCLLLSPAALAQNVINPAHLPPRLQAMEGSFEEKILDCTVTPIHPQLNFSFRIQAGYMVRVPMGQYRGSGHSWISLMRITPHEGGGKPVFLGVRTRLPDVPKTNVEVEVGGGYLLGEGKYNVRWMMLDDQERVCRKDWTVEAKLSHADRNARVAMSPNTVDAFSLRGSPNAALTRDDKPPFRVTILLHAAPMSPRRTRLRVTDQMTLIGSLSALMERLPARSVRMVAFNLDQQKELYRSDHFDAGDIQQVFRAMSTLELDAVDYHTLLNRQGHMDLLAGLVNQELRAEEPSDAVVVLGPVTRFVDKLPQSLLEKPPGNLPRFFFFQYKPVFRQQAAIPDTLTVTVNSLKGKVFTIHTPGEFAKAIDQLEKRATAN